MPEKASNSQLDAGLNPCGTLSHVYIQHPPLQCRVSGSVSLYYDDGNKLLLSPTSYQVFSWRVVPFSTQITPSSYSIGEGPVLSIRYSLDAKFVAIQRSGLEIQIWHIVTGETFGHRCRPESESILGFFWTDCPQYDFVLVKTSGFDLLACNSKLKLLQLVEKKRSSVSWYTYTHGSRLLLLASGIQSKTLTGFQISSSGTICLPKFEVLIAKSDANSEPVLAAEDISIITVYGRIYCLQIDSLAMQLNLYRFYCDAVVLKGSLPIYSRKIAASVIDNVLLVHQLEAKVAILYDIFSDSWAPITAPLPLLVRCFRDNDNFSSDCSISSNFNANIYGVNWRFLAPDLICDVENCFLWKIYLDLEAISASNSQVPVMLDFLQRRKLEAYKAKQLCLVITRTAILEGRPVHVVSMALDVLVNWYSQSTKTSSNSKGRKAEEVFSSRLMNSCSSISGDNQSEGIVDALGKSMRDYHNVSSESSTSDCLNIADVPSLLSSTIYELQEPQQIAWPTISPDEICSFVFASVGEDMTADSSYLIDIIIEFVQSICMEKLRPHPNLYVLTVQLLAQCERFAELSFLIVNKVLEPSKEVAVELMELGHQNCHVRKLGLDMVRQLALHHDYVELLVQQGYYLEALRHAKKYKVTSLRASLYLEAACASHDSQNLAAIIRFFLDLIPGFRNTVDYENSYHHIFDVLKTL